MYRLFYTLGPLQKAFPCGVEYFMPFIWIEGEGHHFEISGFIKLLCLRIQVALLTSLPEQRFTKSSDRTPQCAGYITLKLLRLAF